MNPQQLPAETQQHVRFEGHVTDELLITWRELMSSANKCQFSFFSIIVKRRKSVSRWTHAAFHLSSCLQIYSSFHFNLNRNKHKNNNDLIFSVHSWVCVRACVSVKHQPPQADTQTCAAGWQTLISLHANDSLTNCTGCSGLLIVARQKSEEGTGALGAQLLSAVWCYCHLVAVLGKVKKHTERLTGDILGATTITCCWTLMQRRAPGTSTAGAGFGLAAGNRSEHFSNFSHSFVGQTVTIMITITCFSLHHRHIIYPIPVPVLVLKPQNGCEWTDDTSQTWDMLNSCCQRLHKNTGGVSLLVETRVVSNSCITLFSIYHSHKIFRNLDHWF